jgi:regulatory protein
MNAGKKSTARDRRGPRKATPERLGRAALHYLERYASSAENLRRVLMRRVHRSAMIHGTDPEEGRAAIDDIISRYRDAGLLDDAAYAEMRVRTLHRRGASRRLIGARLAERGVARDDIDRALEALDADSPAPDLEAACNYARRRRLGPWRHADRTAHRERDLAALGRQGYSMDIALKVVDAADVEMLEAECAAGEA